MGGEVFRVGKVMTVVEISLRAGSSYSMRLTGRRKVWVDRPALNRAVPLVGSTWLEPAE